jgi:hypothetical protein
MILVTAYSHSDEFSDVLPEIDGHIAKPVSQRALQMELARCLGLATEAAPEPERRMSNKQHWARFHGLDILLVEDHEINQEVILELLANNGEEALNESRAEHQT